MVATKSKPCKVLKPSSATGTTRNTEIAVPTEINGTASPQNDGPEVKPEKTVTSDLAMIDPTIVLARSDSGDKIDNEKLGTDELKPLNMSTVVRAEVKGHNDRKRRASADSLDSLMTKASESIADDASKDDEDENDDEEDDKLSTSSHEYDPERLKAFNMFVRLFVDENLDRVVPISKQPKDKVQAILDACDRQFPEFHERSRKRIRTYLKSCRRMRRTKDANGWEQLRPTPPHLTSAAAEALLAFACENESNNAKRMRMGLDPLPSSGCRQSPIAMNQPSSTSPAQILPSANASPTQTPLASHPTTMSPPAPSLSLDKQPPVASEFPRHAPTLPSAFQPPHQLPSPFLNNTNGIFQPGFPASFQSSQYHHSPVAPHHGQLASHLQNGPTDLSMKNKPKHTTSPSKNQLNSTEVTTIKQLIAGYRESAAFLCRSADELEQLLLHRN